MMNVSSTKTNNTDSPKTPGGISKCYLTPCRRVGLSRKWKKGGVSPFVSPLTSSESIKEDKQDSVVRKRKKCNVDIEEKDEDRATSQGSLEEVSSETCSTPKIDVDRTPSRVILPRKKSKILITTHASQENVEKVPQSIVELNNKKIESDEEKIQDCPEPGNILSNCVLDVENKQQSSKGDIKVSKLSRKNSKSSINKLDTVESPKREPNTNRPLNRPSNNKNNSESINNHILESEKSGCNVSIKEKSPNNLTKECIVVIQKKIFKTDKKPKNASTKNVKYIIPPNKSSQTLFDSDTDDLPLCNLNKIEKECNTKEQKTLDETNISLVSNIQNIIDLTKKEVDDSDFVEKKKVNVKKLERTTSTTGLKNKAKEKHKSKLKTVKSVPKSSQSSNSDDDDDFDYGKKRTILIKKTYDKVTKPVKAKSTGSITQKDIDDLKATIEYKKKLLLAKSMTEETEELRELIKKWKVGCQTVLMELVDLMKKKMPDQNMECSELLHLLKIPPELVGYDSDNDSFITPDDTAIILSALKLN